MRKKRQKVKFREKWRKLWSVEKKIHFVMLTVIISLTLIAIIVSTVFLTNALTEQNRQYASEQLGIMASDCEGNLEQYKALMIATVLDDSIQEYCRSESLQTADKVSDNVYRVLQTSVYKGYKQDKIEMRGDRAEMSDFPLYLNTVAGGLDRRDQTIGGFSFVVKIYAVPVVEIIG